ncbi:NHLP bacteriocin system secretion protein [Legionella taurinensis]|uniref:NHLP bacteriocin system secretion protein n=1 Tax=Legionella taurinensis TaxID=70611 RepID=A0A3A5L7G8_9GAMM|nr:NHLP bacteriocin system secretion protein [Legionella taurinensis]MDX1837552.1 NHLP bacteriocin system secretion protein [Legionella taurinensis]PUT40886.1 NHLP bacteriocin system secretion protein [Legionella taurinensis]PUT41641.1 NHLP bacteriocin system secretion protein [Legionella taurinensis]PUT44308.1 NHLP bacteriocin system secretion protein [Legionella taurinensis]PUT48749.1 NHLP bacteriocin system secretion protein [Legionella taurinensis]
MDKLFREKSLNRLNNPEKLDTLFRIVPPLNWLILTTLVLLLGTIAAWSVFGSIDTRVSGNGILISGGQKIYDAIAEDSGRLLTVEVQVGDVVKTGQRLATLKLPLLLLDIENRQQTVLSLRKQVSDLQRFIDKDFKLEQQNNETLRKNWAKDLENANLHLQFLKTALEEREKLVDKVISRQELAELKSNYFKELQLRDEISKKIADNIIEFKRRVEANQQRLIELKNRLRQAEQDVAFLMKKLKVHSIIVSPVDGEVINIIGKPGEIVQPGSKIMDIEPYAETVDAVIYVPAGMGKVVLRGMSAQVVPSTVKKQEYGSIVGVVEDVASFPSSQSSMMAVLANEKLVEDFSQSGPQLYVRVRLMKADTPSHYQWTTSQGPNMLITNGTLCTADIITKSQPPITLVIPSIKTFLGID